MSTIVKEYCVLRSYSINNIAFLFFNEDNDNIDYFDNIGV
ncbi:hypothetical protein QGA_0310 [Clostridioides difficile CD181]|nr:hypothetical protein QEK_4143 [Clostridioides difficile CD131]EQF57064.1 hypothetical protein QGA_0310 [Clostridioides difficile CD181]EQF64832.1 hypothetical protein QGE_4040 [Clostridioides difficile CD200]EQI29227.1 hypothetical protein QOO_1013 [Clostridioides difficile Y165]CCL24382.1 hypothetical protein BN172_5820043 [Clostridioides difficile T15]CCL66843.1 hypothetical protein BN183_3490001 [Clostridioides difficile E7]DAY96191.1 MAG TPA: hypothetical protein [Caudoviricetes sp.]